MDNVQGNIQMLNRYLEGDKDGFSEFLKENTKLVHNLCHSVTWQIYTGCEYYDVYAMAVVKMMENLNRRTARFEIPYDVSLFYYEVLGSVKAELHETYNIVSMPYATKKYLVREGKSREKVTTESFDATGIDRDGLSTQSKAETDAAKIMKQDSPEDIVLHSIEIGEMKDCLLQLSVIQQHIIQGLYFKEMSVAEVAHEENLSSAMVYYHKKAALEKLKQLMAA